MYTDELRDGSGLILRISLGYSVHVTAGYLSRWVLQSFTPVGIMNIFIATLVSVVQLHRFQIWITIKGGFDSNDVGVKDAAIHRSKRSSHINCFEFLRQE